MDAVGVGHVLTLVDGWWVECGTGPWRPGKGGQGGVALCVFIFQMISVASLLTRGAVVYTCRWLGGGWRCHTGSLEVADIASALSVRHLGALVKAIERRSVVVLMQSLLFLLSRTGLKRRRLPRTCCQMLHRRALARRLVVARCEAQRLVDALRCSFVVVDWLCARRWARLTAGRDP